MGGVARLNPTNCNVEGPTESYSLQAVPLWMKAYARKVKISLCFPRRRIEQNVPKQRSCWGTGNAQIFPKSTSSCSQ